MREKDKIRSDILTNLLGDLEQLHKNNEISDETYNALKAKYEKELEEVDEYYDFEDLGDVIREKVERSLKKAFQTSFKGKKGYVGNEFAKEEIIKGKFDSEKVSIDFRVENGRIEIKKSETDEYTILLRKRVRARNREDAEEAFKEIDLTVKQEPSRVTIHATDTVDIVATLPEKRYRVRAESENGAIDISELQGETINLVTENGKILMEKLNFNSTEGRTENGRIELRDLRGEMINLVTENGSVILAGVSVQTLSAQAENGRIVSDCTTDVQELKTEHGSIVTTVSPGESTISTEMGSIKIKVPEDTKAVIEARTDMGRVRCIGGTVESAGKYKRIILNENAPHEAKVRAETDMGSIKVMKA